MVNLFVDKLRVPELVMSTHTSAYKSLPTFVEGYYAIKII